MNKQNKKLVENILKIDDLPIWFSSYLSICQILGFCPGCYECNSGYCDRCYEEIMK